MRRSLDGRRCTVLYLRYINPRSDSDDSDHSIRAQGSRQPRRGPFVPEGPHFQYHVSGVLRLIMSDGTEFDARPGEVTHLPAGHDAYVVGNEPVVVVDWYGA